MLLPEVPTGDVRAATTARILARVAFRTGSLVAAAAAAGAGATSAIAARRLTTTPGQATRRPAVVTDVNDRFVRLAGPGAAMAGEWGLHWPGGYARIGASVPGERRVGMRPLRWATAALRPGQRIGVCGYAWPSDPTSSGVASLGIASEALELHGEAGPMPAWRLGPADGQTWAVLIHGRGSDRAQTFRAARVLASEGVTCLAVTYRGARGSGVGSRCDLGTAEWRDVEPAIALARARGAQRVILGGWSMGGAIAGAVLARSSWADAIDGVLLDAPVLDWGPVLTAATQRLRLPGGLAPLTLDAARRRTGDLAALRPDVLQVPTLLIHGSADPVVPIESSDALAEALPDRVTYLRVEGAGHVTAWNRDPAAYEDAMRAWLLLVR